VGGRNFVASLVARLAVYTLAVVCHAGVNLSSCCRRCVPAPVRALKLKTGWVNYAVTIFCL
jgi:hypothetical protein